MPRFFQVEGFVQKSAKSIAKKFSMIEETEFERIATQDIDPDCIKRSLQEHHARRISIGQPGYDNAWRIRLQEILEVIGRKETYLPRVLALVASNSEKKRKMGLDPVSYLAYNSEVKLPPWGAQKMVRGVFMEAVLHQCTPQTGIVAETGSGWAEHLCNIWLHGGPQEASYYAFEIEEYGRKCAMVLAALEKRMKLETAYFDYTKPDFSLLPKGLKHAVVYSVHSIEQVGTIPMEYIAGICGLAERVTAVHFEPIGWQMIPKPDQDEFTKRHREYCLNKKYNENFWSLVKQAEAKKMITIESAAPNLIGLSYNPSSYICWKKR